MRKYLLMITPDNHNKYYDMEQIDDSTFKVLFGRVGAEPQKKSYSMSLWDKKYNEKIKKGYVDQTSLMAISTTTKSSKISDDQAVSDLIQKLMNFSKHIISENYNIAVGKVTQQQLEKAQKIVDDISNIFQANAQQTEEINKLLIELFLTIPRKMKNVKDHLISTTNSKVDRIIQTEQDNLDALSTQVVVQNDQDETSEETSILDSLGIQIFHIAEDEKKIILNKLASESSGYFKRAFRIVNEKTQKLFEKNLEISSDRNTDLLWHGSRNENWLNILRTGLLIRPSGVVLTGSMFGNGIYFANRARKSIGYTSYRGSYWARGSSNVAYLSLFNVHVGRPVIVEKHGSWCYSANLYEIKKRGGDCLFAKRGADLLNDEIIVYRPEQCTVQYIVEIGD